MIPSIICLNFIDKLIKQGHHSGKGCSFVGWVCISGDKTELMRSIFVDDIFLDISRDEVAVLLDPVDQQSVQSYRNLLLHRSILHRKHFLLLPDPLLWNLFTTVYLFQWFEVSLLSLKSIFIGVVIEKLPKLIFRCFRDEELFFLFQSWCDGLRFLEGRKRLEGQWLPHFIFVYRNVSVWLLLPVLTLISKYVLLCLVFSLSYRPPLYQIRSRRKSHWSFGFRFHWCRLHFLNFLLPTRTHWNLKHFISIIHINLIRIFFLFQRINSLEFT